MHLREVFPDHHAVSGDGARATMREEAAGGIASTDSAADQGGAGAEQGAKKKAGCESQARWTSLDERGEEGAGRDSRLRKVGDPTLVDPTPVSARIRMAEETCYAEGDGNPAGEHGLSGEIVKRQLGLRERTSPRRGPMQARLANARSFCPVREYPDWPIRTNSSLLKPRRPDPNELKPPDPNELKPSADESKRGIRTDAPAPPPLQINEIQQGQPSSNGAVAEFQFQRTGQRQGYFKQQEEEEEGIEEDHFVLKRLRIGDRSLRGLRLSHVSVRSAESSFQVFPGRIFAGSGRNSLSHAVDADR
jgi:hypothetical protein